jgi:hypothetical protein
MRSRRWVELAAMLLLHAVACASPTPLEQRDAAVVSMELDAASPENKPALSVPGDASLGPQDTAPAAVSGSSSSDFLSDVGNYSFNLIAANWEIAAGRDSYLCVRATVPRDAYLNEFAAIGSAGTHHAVLLVDESPSGPDGVAPCDVDRSGQQIFDSNDFTAGNAGHLLLPAGVATHIRAGQQMLLNVHLLNTTGERLMGQSGVLVRTLDAAQVKNVAQVLLAGPEQLQIAPGIVTQHAQCTWLQPATIFGVAPHMHELGTRMKVVAQRAGADDSVLVDSLYSFDLQHIYVTNLIQMRPGDQIQIECSYLNTTQRSVGFGASPRDEMCFAALNVFPENSGATVSCSD